jgi:hypothetical protein
LNCIHFSVDLNFRINRKRFIIYYVWGFFLKKYSDSQCCWKNILILVEEKKTWFRVFVIYFRIYHKNSESGFFPEKYFALCATKKIKILTLVLSKKKKIWAKKAHSLRIVSGFFLLNNDNSFNALGLLKKYFWNYNFSFSYKIWTL